MKKFALIVRNDTGTLQVGSYFNEDEVPSDTAVPLGCTLVHVDPDTTEDYDMLYAMIVEDPEKISVKYLPAHLGGLVWNFDTQKWSFVDDHEKPTLLGLVRRDRDAKLLVTDLHAQVDDYPAGLLEQVLEYRQALRDITDTLDPSWTIEDLDKVVWPEVPHFLGDVDKEDPIQ